jgi:ubiquinone biosynthesis protein COQ9
MFFLAELHQMTSPQTAYEFLDTLLANASSVKNAVQDVGEYSNYIFTSWKGIVRSSGIL